MRILITPGFNPDLDGISAAFSLNELMHKQHKEVTIGFEGQPQLDAKYYLQHLNLELSAIPDQFDTAILVDSSSLQYVPSALRMRPEMITEIIDHRSFNNVEREFPALKHLIADAVGACATIIWERIRHDHVKPSRENALMLHGAILSNTLNLKASVTTERDRTAIKEIEGLDYGIMRAVSDSMFIWRTGTAENVSYTLINDMDPDVVVVEGKMGIAQIEALEGMSLMKEHGTLIQQLMQDAQKGQNLKYVFVTVPSINEGINYICPVDEETEKLLRKYLSTELDHLGSVEDLPLRVLKTVRLLLRKEIKPLLKRFI